MTKKSKKPIITIGVLIGIMIVLFLIGLLTRLREQREAERIADRERLPKVSIMQVQSETKEVNLSLPSFLVGYNVTPILARTNGYLKNFFVDIGDEVKRGQLLCEIDTPDVDAQWVQAKADLESFIAKKEIAAITSERWTKLYQTDSEAVPKEEVDQNSAALKSAIANVESAQANLKHWEVLKDFKFIYAPYDGVITERNIDIGSLISIGNDNLTQPYLEGNTAMSQPLFQLTHSKLLRAFVSVPQPYFPYIQDGIPATVSVPEFPDKVFQGFINRNASSLDPILRTLLAQVNIENSDNFLRPGLYAEVKFSFEPYRPSFIIPIGALIIRSGPPYVAVVKEGDVVSLQEVKIGRNFGKTIEIIQGLHDHDHIVINPNFRIQDRVKVKIVKEENSTQRR